MRLSDLAGFGLEIFIYESDGTVKHLITTEEVEEELERRKGESNE